MYDVVGLGELLIDFTPVGRSDRGNPVFEQNPGGAPPNVLAALCRLGGRGSFIGKVGRDSFGSFLEQSLVNSGIDTRGLRFSDVYPTTLAFVHLDSKGDRSFSFYRKNGADTMLEPDDVNYELIKDAKIFHFGSLTLTCEPARSATLKALKAAKEYGITISYDPNWRPPLWDSEETAKANMLLGLQYADIVKLSENELEFLTAKADLGEGTRQILQEYGIALIMVTLGPDGCYYRMGEHTGRLNTYDTKVSDTTGAGDAFMGAMLRGISKAGEKVGTLLPEQLEEMLDYANAVGALCASKAGGLPSMPGPDEVEHCRRTVGKLVR